MHQCSPELVPNAWSKRSWMGRAGPITSCRSRRNSKGTTPRVPPPSMLRILGPAVTGLTLPTTDTSWEQMAHSLTRKHNSWPSRFDPKIWRQMSQIACPQLSTCSGLLRKQFKHVRCVRNCFKYLESNLRASARSKAELCRFISTAWNCAANVSSSMEQRSTAWSSDSKAFRKARKKCCLYNDRKRRWESKTARQISMI